MTIQDIFKIPIYKTKLDLDIKKLQSFCIEHHRKFGKDTNRVISNVGGYHSNDLSLDDISLQPLIKEIETHSNKFAKAFLNKNKQIMTNIWFNINQYKDSNKAHNHAGMDIAGVYYVKTPSECGHIIFEHPLAHFFGYYYYNMGQPEPLNEYNSTHGRQPSEANLLYLFPSWLIHSVEVNKNQTEERISMSFNTKQMEQSPRRRKF